MTMTPEQIEAKREELKMVIFKAAAAKDKITMFRAFKQKYTTTDLYNKADPESPTGVTKVRRRVIRYFFKNMGEITDPLGQSVLDMIVASGEILFAVHVLQEDQFNILKPHPFDEQKRYFKVILKPEHYMKLAIAAQDEIPAQDAQKRGFIRRLAYGQEPVPEVDEFIKQIYPDLHEDLVNFRAANGGRQIPSEDEEEDEDAGVVDEQEGGDEAAPEE